MKKKMFTVAMGVFVTVFVTTASVAACTTNCNCCNCNSSDEWELDYDCSCEDGSDEWEPIDNCDEGSSEWEPIDNCDEGSDEWEPIDDCDYDEGSDEWEPINDCSNDEGSDEWEPINENTGVSYLEVKSAANVRKGPGTNYCIVGEVTEGDVVGIIGEGDDESGIHWYMTEEGNFIYSGAFEARDDDADDDDADEEYNEEYYSYRNLVVVDLDNQTVKVYKNGKCICTSGCVTGNDGVSDTPRGEFEIEGKEENRQLTGEGYSVNVKYWMPFSGGCGLHDADWREDFGGDIYQGNGSHGCINLPEYMAETIYKTCPEGTTVIVY